MKFILKNEVELTDVSEVTDNEQQFYYRGFITSGDKKYVVSISKYGNCFSIKDTDNNKQLLTKENKKDFSIKNSIKKLYFPKYKKESPYLRVAVFDVDYIFKDIPTDYIPNNKETNPYIKIIEKKKVKLTCDRYRIFKKQPYCCSCKRKPNYFALERFKGVNSKYYHLNLYRVDKNGNEILYTKDHIRPKSLGGEDNIFNYQTMCSTCNTKKGNKFNTKDRLLYLKNKIKAHFTKMRFYLDVNLMTNQQV